ncbi:MAG: VanZ family protein [Pelagibacteraceae bacterium]
MYYINYTMKNNILKLIKYLYYFSLITLVILYLFPGSIIGYFLYNDLGRQPNFIDNPIGTSINHFFYFVYLTSLAIICNSRNKRFFSSLIFIISISIILEILHFIIPNRAFEINDLAANILGVMLVLIIKKLIR